MRLSQPTRVRCEGEEACRVKSVKLGLAKITCTLSSWHRGHAPAAGSLELRTGSPLATTIRVCIVSLRVGWSGGEPAACRSQS